MDLINRIRECLPEIPQPAPEMFGGRVSSVLIAVGLHRFSRREEILLTKRAMQVESHKGQVSFPGGFWEKADRSLIETALRESHEEIGTQPEDIQILGALEPVQTHQGVTIYPWVGHMLFPYPFSLNPAEVEKVIFLPVQDLLAEGLKSVSVRLGDVRVQSVGIFAENELIWGATARILDQLRQRLLRATP